MNTLDMKTPDLAEGNIDKIAALFPEVVTEKEGEDGTPTRSIDFDLLRQALSTSLVEGADERYRLDWPGKRRSLLKANTPITKTLRPVREESVDFDTTENLFIEGDNFEALKILQESYLGKVKMIYIDPPYNTGKDFVYSDKHTMDEEEYTELTGAEDEEGNKLFRENTRTNPRFHSDWLSMMYERLVIARDLLTIDGGIFISIDDNEISNLRKICDEIYGEDNFINSISVKMSELKGAKLAHIDRKFPKLKEHLLIYCKDKSNFKLNPVKIPKSKDVLKKYLRYYSKQIVNIDEDINNWHFITNNDLNDEQKLASAASLIYLVAPDQDVELQIRTNSFSVTKNTEGKDCYYYNDNGDIKTVLFLKDHIDTYMGDLWLHISTININKENYSIPTYSNGQKPLDLLSTIFKAFLSKNDIVLDFFAGSGTTGDALLRFNLNSGYSNKFIMVQIEEKIEIAQGMDNESKKTARKLIDFLNEINKPLFVSEIAKERIRRAAAKIKVDYAESIAQRATPLDTGFRTYRVDETNMKDVYYHPTEVKQESLLDLADNIKEDRTSEDLLTQVMLDLGLTLDLPLEEREMNGNKVFVVADGALVACFDNALHDGVVDAIAELSPLKLVVRDATFGTGPDRDQKRTNLATRMKRLSPDTEITVL